MFLVRQGFFQRAGAMQARFPVRPARELLSLYTHAGEAPERVRSLVQHLIRHDPASAHIYKQALEKYAEERQARGEESRAPAPRAEAN